MSTLSVDTIQGQTAAANVKFPAGAVLNCIQFVYSTYAQITASSYAATGITMNITPKYTSSKVLVQISATVGNNGSNAGENAFALYRAIGGAGAAEIETFERGIFTYSGSGGPNVHVDASCLFQFLDSPNTTSNIVYTLYARASAGTLRINDHQLSGQGQSAITLWEIAG